MKRALSRDFHPPAPLVPVVVRAPGEAEGQRLEGKIDTGADLCAVPAHVVAALDLPPVRTVRAASFEGVLHEVILYRCDLSLAGTTFTAVEALLTRRPYAIVGRNVLQKLVVRVDGPRQQLDISAPRRQRRRS